VHGRVILGQDDCFSRITHLILFLLTYMTPIFLLSKVIYDIIVLLNGSLPIPA